MVAQHQTDERLVSFGSGIRQRVWIIGERRICREDSCGCHDVAAVGEQMDAPRRAMRTEQFDQFIVGLGGIAGTRQGGTQSGCHWGFVPGRWQAAVPRAELMRDEEARYISSSIRFGAHGRT